MGDDSGLDHISSQGKKNRVLNVSQQDLPTDCMQDMRGRRDSRVTASSLGPSSWFCPFLR